MHHHCFHTCQGKRKVDEEISRNAEPRHLAGGNAGAWSRLCSSATG